MEVQRSWIDSRDNISLANGKVLRYVNPVCRFQYEMLKETGLYNRLISEEVLIEQHIIDFVKSDTNVYCVLQQDKIPNVSYSYEWSFDQLKKAALTVLRTQRWALDYGMILKDASAHHIQFVRDRAKLTDALCFEPYVDGTDWVAYDQFCRHFLAPLLLMKHRDICLQQLLRIYHDGIPIDLASKMLICNIDLATLNHIHLHAWKSSRRSKTGINHSKQKTMKIRKSRQISRIESLISIVNKLNM